jgi:hypothetical protein
MGATVARGASPAKDLCSALAAKADAELAVQHARVVLDKVRNTMQRRLNKRALELHSFKKK